MPGPPSKEQITHYLRQNNIAVPENASYAQLKVIYDELKQINQNTPTTNTGAIPKKPSSVTTTAAQITSSVSTTAASNPTVTPVPVSRQPIVTISTPSTSAPISAPIVRPSPGPVNRPIHDTPEDSLIAELESLKRLLTLQKEIEDLRQGASDCIMKKVSFDDVRHMAPFSGTGGYRVERWVHDFENLIESVNGNDADKLRLVRRFLEGSAKKAVQYKTYTKWADIKAELLAVFELKIFKSNVYKTLERRTKKYEETIEEYIINMQELAYLGDITEEELIPFIVRGLRDNTTAQMLYGANNLAALRKLVPMYEQAKIQYNWVNQKPNREVNVQRKDVTCYKCAEKGHIANACTKKMASVCFNCKQPGHVIAQCPLKNKAAVVITESEAAQLMQEISLQTEEESDVAAVQAIQEVCFTPFKEGEQRLKFNLTNALFDTGSPVNFIGRSMMPENIPVRAPALTKYTGLGSKPLYSFGIVNFIIKYKTKMHIQKIFIVDDSLLPTALLLGRNFMKKFGIKLEQINSEKNIIHINKSFLKAIVHTYVSNESLKNNIFDQIENNLVISTPNGDQLEKENECKMIHELSITNINELCDIDLMICNINENQHTFNIDPKCDEDTKTRCSILINDYLERMHTATVNPHNHEMTINLENKTPFFCAPRRLSFHEREAVNKKIEELLKLGYIRASSSPYASPIVPIKKKNGELRMCIDYRTLNKSTLRDNFPIPLIDTCVEFLEGKKIFSLIDLKHGFHQLKMNDDSIKYTSFVSPDGQFEFTRVPFGLKNGPAVFQRFIYNSLQDMIVAKELIVYIDDILIATVAIETHLQILKKLFDRLNELGLMVKIGKCKFVQTELDYLGYAVTEKGIRPNEKHIETIKQYPMPKNLKETFSCLGLFSYFRKFVPSFSKIAAPLHNLLKQNTTFHFNKDCERAFHILKQLLIAGPVLSIYSRDKDTELHTDASANGFGAILLQKQDDNKWHPVSYFSKRATEAESRYHSFELETLAIIYAIRRFHHYLSGKPFTIITDCNALTLTLERKKINPRIARWALELENYEYKALYRKGTSMGHVDALSRNFVALVNEDETDLQLQITQSRDPKIITIRSQLEEGQNILFELRDGLVFRKIDDNHFSFYVPEELEHNVIQLIHEKIGHLGIDKCYLALRTHYWFPNMKPKIENFIKNCIKCIMYKKPQRKNERVLHSIPKTPLPFHTLHADLCGPLPSITSKKKHILVITDAFTKYCKIYPVTATSSKEVIICFNKFFDYYGRPINIITDRGSCFTSLEFSSFIIDNNITHHKVATASPQANGQVEIMNKIIVPILGKISEAERQADWAKLIPKVEFSLNNHVSKSTKFTPSMLLFGVNQRGPKIDFLTEHLDEKNDTIHAITRNLDVIRQQADKNIKIAQATNEKYYAQHSVPPQKYFVGEFVVIKNIDTTIGVNKKLAPKYKGPYKITKILPNDRYVLSDIETFQVTQIPYNGILEAANIKHWRKAVKNTNSLINNTHESLI